MWKNIKIKSNSKYEQAIIVQHCFRNDDYNNTVLQIINHYFLWIQMTLLVFHEL